MFWLLNVSAISGVFTPSGDHDAAVIHLCADQRLGLHQVVEPLILPNSTEEQDPALPFSNLSQVTAISNRDVRYDMNAVVRNANLLHARVHGATRHG